MRRAGGRSLPRAQSNKKYCQLLSIRNSDVLILRGLRQFLIVELSIRTRHSRQVGDPRVRSPLAPSVCDGLRVDLTFVLSDLRRIQSDFV